MTKAKPYRPALAEMGRWKWLAIGLVAIPVVLTGPYALQSGGRKNGLDATSAEATLADCPFRYAMKTAKDKVSVTASFHGGCSALLSKPFLRLINATGEDVAKAALKGQATALRASVSIPNTALPTQVYLEANSREFGLAMACIGVLNGPSTDICGCPS